jgi:hypothetical protein
LTQQNLKGKPMSNQENEGLLEKFFAQFLEEGFSETQAEALAHQKLEESS